MFESISRFNAGGNDSATFGPAILCRACGAEVQRYRGPRRPEGIWLDADGARHPHDPQRYPQRRRHVQSSPARRTRRTGSKPRTRRQSQPSSPGEGRVVEL